MNSVRNVILKARMLKSRADDIKSVVKTNLNWIQFQSYRVQENTFEILQKLHHFRSYGFRQPYDQDEKNLVDYLSRRIFHAYRMKKTEIIPTFIKGFKTNLDGDEVILTKKLNNETIRIKFNVTHSLDTDPEIKNDQDILDAELGEFKSKPDFMVEIIREDSTLCLNCSFILAARQADKECDVFAIKDISIYNKEWKENSYSISNEVLNTDFNSYMLNYLKQKGITNTFAEKLMNFSTKYEHLAFINTLEELSKFVLKK